jgi:starvation-inducible DNA-binding protein
MTKFKTKIGIAERIREEVCTLLQQNLTNAIDLSLQCKQAHWNVKGANFIGLHELFDKIAEEVSEHADTLAERIAQFGFPINGTTQNVAKTTQLPAYPLTAVTGSQHVNALAHALATFGEGIRTAIDEADKFEDKGTADIFTSISRSVDKSLWFVEAHIQAEG